MTEQHQQHIVLIGSNDRAALQFARSLGRNGHFVTLIRLSADKTAADFSKYVKISKFLGDPHSDISGFQAALLAFLSAQKIDFVLPINDQALVSLTPIRAKIERLAILIAPSAKQTCKLTNKGYVTKLMQSFGFDAPPSLGQPLPAKPPFPIFLRYNYSYEIIANNLIPRAVKKIKNKKELDTQLYELSLHSEHFYQKAVSGFGYGLNFLSFKGTLVACSKTIRLHEPIEGGGSSYRKNSALNSQEIDFLTEFATSLNYSGFGMLEFKKAGDKNYFIEMNCRPWGSIATAIHAGIDYPNLAVEAFGSHSVPELVVSEKDVYCRHLRKDIFQFLKYFRGKKFQKGMVAISSFAKSFSPAHHLDVETFDDILPAVMQYALIAKTSFAKISILQLVLKCLILRGVSRVELTKETSILFVCKGNINRSVVAAKMAQEYGAKRVTSAALLAKPNRPCSREAQEFLAAQGIKDTRNISITLKSLGEIRTRFDLVVCFDYRDLFRLVQSYPETRGKMVLFSQLYKRFPGTVKDPYGRSQVYFEQCFGSIRDGLQTLLR